MPYNKFSITTKKKKKNVSKDMPSRKRKNPLESFNFVLRAWVGLQKNILRLTELVNIISNKSVIVSEQKLRVLRLS